MLREIISYGYEISRQIREKTSDGYVIRETTLYSVFARLENAGYIESYSGSVSMGRPRTYYRITDAGRTYYRQKCQEWQEIQDLLQPFIEEE
ncbi:MAG: PadR family transcriptional regulator [Eubacteriales bacterium]|nr:PadR family transcriptional regulator [Eubacteriales bacterium]